MPPPAMFCCATTARPQPVRRRIPKCETQSNLKKQRLAAYNRPLVGQPHNNSRGSSCLDIRTVLRPPAWVRYGKSAAAAPRGMYTRRFPTSPVFKTSFPSITGKSSTTGRLSSSCKTCCTASETLTSWTSKWARARSWSRR